MLIAIAVVAKAMAVIPKAWPGLAVHQGERRTLRVPAHEPPVWNVGRSMCVLRPLNPATCLAAGRAHQRSGVR